jgi:hypothetical protein
VQNQSATQVKIRHKAALAEEIETRQPDSRSSAEENQTRDRRCRPNLAHGAENRMNGGGAVASGEDRKAHGGAQLEKTEKSKP